MDSDAVVAATRDWVEKHVIGLNLCPFARAVHESNRIRYVVTDAETPVALRNALIDELLYLKTADPAQVETTLLIHPRVLGDFLEYNDFLDIADDLLRELGLVGDLQVASFHPQYQFADTAADDVTNRTNRSPYPTLHLLREESVERALADYPDPDEIPRRNVETMKRLYSKGGEATPPPAAS